MAETFRSIRRIQESLHHIAEELRDLDRRLDTLAASAEPVSGHILPAEIADGVHAVRADLLVDAIDTLAALGGQSEEGALERRRAVEKVSQRLAAFA